MNTITTMGTHAHPSPELQTLANRVASLVDPWLRGDGNRGVEVAESLAASHPLDAWAALRAMSTTGAMGWLATLCEEELTALLRHDRITDEVTRKCIQGASLGAEVEAEAMMRLQATAAHYAEWLFQGVTLDSVVLPQALATAAHLFDIGLLVRDGSTITPLVNSHHPGSDACRHCVLRSVAAELFNPQAPAEPAPKAPPSAEATQVAA